MLKVFIIGHTFPEPTTTAAGERMMQLIALFQEWGYVITFGSTATISERSHDLAAIGISSEMIALNDASFDRLISQLAPDIVVFDRYITEEQFGWRVAENCPNAFRILDTEDLHFLRKARQEAATKESALELYSDTAKRELASILRCDVSLIISKYELNLLQDTFRVPSGLLYYLPFLVTPVLKEVKERQKNIDGREHFVTIGNLLHAPNADSVLYLKRKIWPQIRLRLPKAELHVYGHYAPQHILELDKPSEGFYIKGWTPNATEVLSKAKICLAPLQFGAGLKGKFIQSMQSGTPIITTSIGAEGMFADHEAPGVVANDVNTIVDAAVTLYENTLAWAKAQEQGYVILENSFSKVQISEAFKKQLDGLLSQIKEHRRTHFLGAILQHQSLQATKYMSKWIEEKNKHL